MNISCKYSDSFCVCGKQDAKDGWIRGNKSNKEIRGGNRVSHPHCCSHSTCNVLWWSQMPAGGHGCLLNKANWLQVDGVHHSFTHQKNILTSLSLSPGKQRSLDMYRSSPHVNIRNYSLTYMHVCMYVSKV